MSYDALYLHIPFCKARCYYCDFESRACTGRSEVDAYIKQLIELVDARGLAGELDAVETVYIGGGTPTVAGPALERLVRSVARYCSPVEFTVEANPESFTADIARALRSAGVSRISLGIQSLVDGELESIGRIHTAREALGALQLSKANDFVTSCDLMCGLPGQTIASFQSSLDAVLAAPAPPDHVSVYPLQLEEETPLSRMVDDGLIDLPDEDFQAECMELASRRLVEEGFARYEVASYARPSCICRHNLAYWTGSSYLGLGRSAASMSDAGAAGRDRFVQLDDVGVEFDREHLSAREAAAEDLMLACRTARGVSRDLLERSSRYIPRAALEEACKRAVFLGLAAWHGDHLEPTRLGWLEGNALFGIFWDLAAAS